VLKMV